MGELGIDGPKITPDLIDPLLIEHEDSEGPARLKLWDIEYFFKCPVVGICLAPSEQRQVLKKVGISFKRKSAFEIHEILVAGAEKKGRLSARMDHLLNHKFAAQMEPLFDLDEKAFMVQWEACFRSGEYGAAFWAAVTRPDLTDKSRRKIFGAIHMAMHGNVEQRTKLKRQLAFQQERATDMALKAREANRARKSLLKENRGLYEAQDLLIDKLAASEKKNGNLENALSMANERSAVGGLERENARLKEELDILSARVEEKEKRVATLKEQNRCLSAEIERQRALSARFQEEAQELVKEMFAQTRCDTTCPSFDLCQRRVLIVGGLTKMESLYRKMIEENGGVFEYHDGYTRGGTRDLDSRVKRADVVLCPVDCNSHSACSMTKRLGKKYGRTVKMLPGSGLSAISQALLEYCDVQSIQ